MVIDCKAISQAKRDAIKRKAAELDITPTLAVILAVDDPASRVYVRNKRRACEEVGFGFEIYSDINAVGELVTRQDVHGVLVQLPLPSAALCLAQTASSLAGAILWGNPCQLCLLKRTPRSHCAILTPKPSQASQAVRIS